MRLRGIEFGNVWNASGGRNFFPDAGYPFHRWLKPFGLDYSGSTFVAKTTTLDPREGNMPMKDDGITPKEFKPACIIVKPFVGVALNAVGLSGPGAFELLKSGRWQKIREPFLLSFMAVGKTPEEREDEARSFAAHVRYHMTGCDAPFGVEVNFTCPNVGLPWEVLAKEIRLSLNHLATLLVPVIPKLNAIMPVGLALEIEQHPACDAIVMSNTIPWGKLPKKINWKELFGTDVSPLATFGGGGLSGTPLLPIVRDWIESARSHGFKKPIVGCGGVLSREDADALLDAGADAIELGSISFLRPWRVAGIIRHVNTRFAQKQS